MTLENRNDELDARLSAYAFGELEGGELAEMEARVGADPLLAIRVAELRAFAEELGAALKDEPAPPGIAVASAGDAAFETDPGDQARPSGGRLLRFPSWRWTAAGFAAAAGVAVVVSLHEAELPAGRAELGQNASPKADPISAPTPPADHKIHQATVPASSQGSIPVVSTPAKDETLFAPDFSFEEKLAEAKRAFFDASDRRENRVGDSYAGSSPMIVAEPSAGIVYPSAPPPPTTFGGQRGAGGSAISGTVRQEVSSAKVRWAAASGERAFATRAPRYGTVSLSTLVPAEEASAESYAGLRESEFVEVESVPLSTFSIDVDTASYANARRFLQNGRRPPREAVRVEEFINYFPYRYAPPAAGSDAPFAAHLAVSSAPWAPEHLLVRVAVKGREFAPEARPPANLVFLVDVSGSMSSANKLPLVKASLRQLLGQLRADDRVAIVTYAGASGLALPSTPASRGGEILDALDRLESGGSTNGGMGIHLAYDIAKANFRPEGVNRVILCTDGDFNVGVTGRSELLSLIQEKARSRVFLTVLGFGMGNLKDGTLEMLADKGNGAYGYIDSEREARKVFVEQVEGTLATIAKDVKIQVEFNPARVASYRLIGYENRALAKEDFNNDQVDAGEVGAGHTVTALYEIVPVGASAAEASDVVPEVDSLKYGPKKRPAPVRRPPTPAPAGGDSDELLTVKIRYKAPDGDVSRKLEFPLVDRRSAFAAADAEFKFAAAVAAWGMLLRGSPHAGSATCADVLRWAEDGLAADPGGHRAEFVGLVRRTQGADE